MRIQYNNPHCMHITLRTMKPSLLIVATTLLFLQQASALSNTGWRIALNIGREPNSRMPSSWASSGCRLPIVVKCDFQQDQQRVVPKENVVRFTGPDGEVINKIEPGKWSLANNRNLQFSFTFPESLSRRDVILDPCSIQCEGLLYSKLDLKELNDAFYKARDETWKAGETVNEIARRKDAPKKWNPETERWEERYSKEGFASKIGKRVGLFRAQQKQRNESSNRPNPKDLSLDCGPFPGVEGDAFIKSGSTIRLNGKAIIGTWSAEPINGKPVSYFS